MPSGLIGLWLPMLAPTCCGLFMRRSFVMAAFVVAAAKANDALLLTVRSHAE
jgi:hypothetical protein